MIFIFNYCYIVYLFLRSVNLLSFVCETYIFIFIYYRVIKTLYNLFSFQMTNHRKYRFHRTDTGQYRHRHRTEVRYRFRFSQKTGTDTGTGEPYLTDWRVLSFSRALSLFESAPMLIDLPVTNSSVKRLVMWIQALTLLVDTGLKIQVTILLYFYAKTISQKN